MQQLATLAAVTVLTFGCGSGQPHVAADAFPLVAWAHVAGTTEEPSVSTAAAPGYEKWIAVVGPRRLNEARLQHAEETLLEEEGWQRDQPIPDGLSYVSDDKKIYAMPGEPASWPVAFITCSSACSVQGARLSSS